MTKGKAFEYATARLFFKYFIGLGGIVEIIDDKNYINVKDSFDSLNSNTQNLLLRAASVGVAEVVQLEPKLQDINEKLVIRIAPDSFGKNGDVRDVILSKKNWEIGVSCKHNHQALKHQRLSNIIDFGQVWAGYPVSRNYWDEVNPIFQMLQNYKSNGLDWKDIPNKEQSIYVPLLTSFLKELNFLDSQYTDLAYKFTEYLAGRRDFYKFVMDEKHKGINIYCYNLHGELGTDIIGSTVPLVSLPTAFISKKWKLNIDNSKSNTTLIIEMDNDWIVGLRLHSASTKVETSLKFDSQPIKLPNNLLTIRRQF